MATLVVFAKPPQANQVKTRLIPDIGAARAAQVYRYCLEHTISAVRESGINYKIFLTEETTDPLFENQNYQIQHGDDLGSRMLHAMSHQLEEHAEAAIIIGTDCLDLTSKHLLGAVQALDKHDMVLMPTFDGGYALIGCRQINPDLFNAVRWSTSQVLNQTLKNAQALNYQVSLLETVRDIDTLRDLEHYPELVKLITPTQ